VIDRGKLIAEGTIAELKARRRADRAVVVVADEGNVAAKTVEAVEGIAGVSVEPAAAGTKRLIVRYAAEDDGAMLEAIVRALVLAEVGIREAGPDKASLEDVFVQLTLAEAALQSGSEAPS
jgi:ABC-2 type transport system ATP-binding protein